jgi:hypothetical protein
MNKPFVVSYGQTGKADNHEEFDDERNAITRAIYLRSLGIYPQITVYKFMLDSRNNICGQQSIWYYRGK